jgi:hypothetical protein
MISTVFTLNCQKRDYNIRYEKIRYGITKKLTKK